MAKKVLKRITLIILTFGLLVGMYYFVGFATGYVYQLRSYSPVSENYDFTERGLFRKRVGDYCVTNGIFKYYEWGPLRDGGYEYSEYYLESPFSDCKTDN